MQSCAGSELNNTVMGDNTLSRILIKGSRVTCLAICTTTLLCRVLFSGSSALERGCCSMITGLTRMSTVLKCYGTAICSSEISSWVYRSMNRVSKSISRAKFLTFLKQTFTCKFSTRTKKSTVLSNVIGSLNVLCCFAVGRLFSSCFRSP